MDPLKFDNSFIYKTGERIIPGSVSAATLSEHYTRYYFALELCRGKKILNVACGAGYGSEILLQSASEVYNIDLSEQLVAYGNLHYGNYKNHFLTMDAQKMDFPDEFFDVIVSFETFEHLPQYQEFLDECYRILKKDGRFIISMPNKNITSPDLVKPRNPFHFKEWTVPEFEKLISSQFKILSLYGQNKTHPRVNYPYFGKIYRSVSGLLYIYTPAFILRIVKVYFLKYKTVLFSEVKLLSKDRIIAAQDIEFDTHQTGLSYAILIVILKKLKP